MTTLRWQIVTDGWSMDIDEELPEALDGERLDRVVSMLGDVSRAKSADLIAAGGVAVDGQVISQRSFRVTAGSRVVFVVTQEAVPVVSADASVVFEVAYADDDVIVVDKPPGLVVHPGAGRPDQTLVNGLLHQFPDIAGVGEDGRPGIVHRLDADTSGLLVVARNQAAYTALVASLSERDVHREYRAVTHGVVADDRGLVDAPIGRSSQKRTRMAVIADGREARTHYEVLARRYDAPPASVLALRLETGRTHQIRVHLAAIGHAVVGDPTYGQKRKRASADDLAGFGRVALHAYRLGFTHPGTGSEVSFETAVPSDLQQLIDAVSSADAAGSSPE